MLQSRVSSLGWVFATALLAGAAGCVKETRPQPVLQATQATTEIASDQLLDVGVHILDPGIPKGVEDDPDMADKLRVYPDIRNAEARYIAMELRNTLEDTGQWGTARVVPTTVMKFVSPFQRGTTCMCRWPGTPAPAGLPRLIPMFMPCGA